MGRKGAPPVGAIGFAGARDAIALIRATNLGDCSNALPNFELSVERGVRVGKFLSQEDPFKLEEVLSRHLLVSLTGYQVNFFFLASD